jgi:GT2 family glycosyltransferase
MIASIVSNSEKWLPKFFEAIDGFTYPPELLSYAFLTGNNTDSTFEMLDDFEVTHQGTLSWDKGENRRKEKVWLKGLEFKWDGISRFVKLATLRNHLIMESLEDEEYVLFVDSDVVKMPPDMLRSLLAVDADIVAPMVYIDNFREFEDTYFYDTLAFIDDKNLNFEHTYPYVPGLKDLPSQPVYINSVGTCYLIDSKVFRAGVKYQGSETLSEQIGFCQRAKAAGFRVAVAPDVGVLHCNFELYGEEFKP